MDALSGESFQIFAVPFTGMNLIEASAGTGKTRAITDLYVRIIVETAWQVPEILVVTFTNAATAELRDRVRTRLALARDAFLTETTLDPFCQQLVDRYPSRLEAIQRLDRAIRSFDEAAISTIHGFCQRVLAEAAFDSGRSFENELLPDDREIIQDTVDDFWRREVYQASPLFVQYLLAAGYTPEQLCALVRPYLGKPYLRVVAPEHHETAPQGQCVEALEEAFGQAYAAARGLWQSEHSVVVDLLRHSPALNRNQYRLSSIPGWITCMTECLTLDSPNGALFANFNRFGDRRLSEAVKRGHQPPQHPFFTVCDGLLSVHELLVPSYTRRVHALTIALLNYCRDELGACKRRRQLQSYDDLLLHLELALHGRHGDALASGLRQRYPVALIDEFQDTDPVQYRIFHRVYHGTSATMFLVGDPKQAIYSFRGADIFAYLHACHDADQRYTLDVNWRSEPHLIQAVNALFARARLPFLFEDITFAPVTPASEPREAFLEHGQRVSPLHVWCLDAGTDGQALTKAMAGDLAAQATANEIVRLLEGGACGQIRIGDRPLEGGDIAVLVRSHRQGWQVQEQLRQRGVPSVQLGQDNVFQAGEAQELERVLLAVAEPTSDARLRGALTTVMLGVTGEALGALSEDEEAWEARLEDFLEYHRLWREHGFARMFRTLVSRERVPQRLLQFQDGERRLTNLWHVAERLQLAADRERTGMERLITWLADRRQSEATADEEEQLRLESDEHLVTIVTIHKSKGLEYPVVFCPFLWSGGLWSRSDNALLCHDPDDAYQAVLDLGSDQLEVWRPHACQEEMAENLRLLYVALTRAKSRCYLVWGKINNLGTSPLAWVLHQPEALETPLTPDDVEAYVQARSATELWADLESWAAQAHGAIALTPPPVSVGTWSPPSAPAEPRLTARRFPWPIRQRWRIISFSALTASDATEVPDYDALAPAPSQDMTIAHPPSIVTFPRGVRAGSCWHAILQRLDFASEDRGAMEALVRQYLGEYGYDSVWMPVVVETLERVMATPLDRAGTLHLKDVPLDRRLDELEFTYPLTGLTCEQLQQWLHTHGFTVGSIQEDIGRLAFTPARGYMKGFIDLIFEAGGRFYLTDYKSNWLGETPEAYREEALPAVMAQHSYSLQYLIYVIALHRYLKLRLPNYDYEAQFGGVLYLFLRGMDPGLGPGYGVFRARPTRDLIEGLDEYLATGSLQR